MYGRRRRKRKRREPAAAASLGGLPCRGRGAAAGPGVGWVAALPCLPALCPYLLVFLGGFYFIFLDVVLDWEWPAGRAGAGLCNRMVVLGVRYVLGVG